MVEIGWLLILCHIMKIYAAAGYSDFVICLGYKGDVIRDYFLNYEVRNRDFTITLGCGRVEIHDGHAESGWRITLAETGEHTLTGGGERGGGGDYPGGTHKRHPAGAAAGEAYWLTARGSPH